MKVCPTCKSERVQEYLVGWFDADSHERGVSDEPLTLATRYPDQFWCCACGKTQDELLEVPDVERPPWWEMPEDVAAAMAREMSEWYRNDGRKPYRAIEVRVAWRTVRLRTVDADPAVGEPERPYPEVFFYDMDSKSWGYGLDTADREWISNMIDEDRRLAGERVPRNG